jgi:hypothetical protein
METTTIERLIKVRQLMKQLKAEESVLEEELKLDDNFHTYKGDEATISKSVRNTVSLKKDVDQDFVMSMFPEAVVTKVSLDMDMLRKDERAHELLEIKQTPVITVKLK